MDLGARVNQGYAENIERHKTSGNKGYSGAQEEPWESGRLSAVMKEEFRRGLNTTLSIVLWRHAAIAISRRHLPEGTGFKRDYGPDEYNAAMDSQAAHTSSVAGIC